MLGKMSRIAGLRKDCLMKQAYINKAGGVFELDVPAVNPVAKVLEYHDEHR
jgi:hypothetical protein